MKSLNQIAKDNQDKFKASGVSKSYAACEEVKGPLFDENLIQANSLLTGCGSLQALENSYPLITELRKDPDLKNKLGEIFKTYNQKLTDLNIIMSNYF